MAVLLLAGCKDEVAERRDVFARALNHAQEFAGQDVFLYGISGACQGERYLAAISHPNEVVNAIAQVGDDEQSAGTILASRWLNDIGDAARKMGCLNEARIAYARVRGLITNDENPVTAPQVTRSMEGMAAILKDPARHGRPTPPTARPAQ